MAKKVDAVKNMGREKDIPSPPVPFEGEGNEKIQLRGGGAGRMAGGIFKGFGRRGRSYLDDSRR
tara:strand:- start:2586 stop:2777 length:192 start_codon:yes stop_codon:yes gene_type:complete